MGKASTGKKVARAASTGGGRTARGSTPWGWWSAMVAVVVLGIAGVAVSRSDYTESVDRERPSLSDHWHSAYGFYNCDAFAKELPQPAKLIGIHTHTDGLMHVEPQNSADTGRNATVGRFDGGHPDFEIDEDSITYPGVGTRKNGDKCGDEPGTLQIKVWDGAGDTEGEIVEGDPKDIRLADGQRITFAFVPEGTDIPQPPSVPNLADPNKGEGHPGGETTTTVPGGGTVPGAETTTTVAGGDPAATTTSTDPAPTTSSSTP